MKPISVHVSEPVYEAFKHLASAQDRSIAELIREAMSSYLDQAQESGPSLLDLPRLGAGRELRAFSRAEVYDEMFGS